MNWSTLLQTLLGVVVGALLAFGSAYLMERRREGTARAIQLRNSYSRWLALRAMTSLDLQLLAGLTGELPYRDSAYIDLLATELGAARPNIRALTELGFDILSLETEKRLRNNVATSVDTTTQVYALASRLVRAHQSSAYWRNKVSTLERQLTEIPSDHPERPSLVEGLAQARADLQGQFETHLAASPTWLKELADLNARLVELGRQLVEVLAAHNRQLPAA